MFLRNNHLMFYIWKTTQMNVLFKDILLKALKGYLQLNEYETGI